MNIIIYIVYTIYDTNAWSEIWKNNIKEKNKGRRSYNIVLTI